MKYENGALYDCTLQEALPVGSYTQPSDTDYFQPTIGDKKLLDLLHAFTRFYHHFKPQKEVANGFQDQGYTIGKYLIALTAFPLLELTKWC